MSAPAQLGKLAPPYPVERCALCEAKLTEDAYLFRNLNTDHREQFLLVALIEEEPT